jgi:hypothetical protein
MAQGDPKGWESLGVNDPTIYKSTQYLNNERSVKTPIRVITNRADGNYDVYSTSIGVPDILIYSYNTSNNKVIIKDQTLYKDYFTGKNTQQFDNFNKSIKVSTLKLAQNNVSGGTNSTSGQQLQKLINSSGYKSLANATPSPQAGGGAGTGNPAQTSLAGAGGASKPPLSGAQLESINEIKESKTGLAVNALNSVIKSNDSKFLRYPLNPTHADDEDMLKIDIYKYEKSGLTIDGIKDFKLKSMTDRLTSSIKTIYLPAYNSNGISDSLTVGWGSGELNAISARFANTAMQTIGSGTDPAEALKELTTGLTDNITDLATAPELKTLLVNYFTEQAIQTTGLLSRTSGAAVNNNIELLFTGANLRDFTLTYRLTPRSSKEAQMIKNIIRAFKITMTPSLSPSGLFLLAPCVYKLSYITKNKVSHPYLNKFKACALKGFNVNYTPDGNYMTYADGLSMTQYEMQLQFGEVDPIYRDDYDGTQDTMGY